MRFVIEQKVTTGLTQTREDYLYVYINLSVNNLSLFGHLKNPDYFFLSGSPKRPMQCFTKGPINKPILCIRHSLLVDRKLMKIKKNDHVSSLFNAMVINMGGTTLSKEVGVTINYNNYKNGYNSVLSIH